MLTTADFGKKKYSIVGNVGFPRKDALWMIILMCFVFCYVQFWSAVSTLSWSLKLSPPSIHYKNCQFSWYYSNIPYGYCGLVHEKEVNCLLRAWHDHMFLFCFNIIIMLSHCNGRPNGCRKIGLLPFWRLDNSHSENHGITTSNVDCSLNIS